MADEHHIENHFLAISGHHIDRLMWNSEQRWRITCRYRSHHLNGNSCKFKMADGRHFENSFISISQPWIIQFRSIWFTDANFHSEDGHLTKESKFFKFKMANGRHI